MKTKPELGSNHLHGKDVGNQEDSTSCGSHHHPQKCFLCMWKDYDVWNFTWEEQKPNSCESSQKAAQQGPGKVVDQAFGQVWVHLNDNSNEEGRLASSSVWQPAKRVGADHHACHEERLDTVVVTGYSQQCQCRNHCWLPVEYVVADIETNRRIFRGLSIAVDDGRWESWSVVKATWAVARISFLWQTNSQSMTCWTMMKASWNCETKST